MNSFAFWQKWLLGISGLFVLGGLALAFLGGTPLMAALLDGLITAPFWASPEVTPAIRSYQQFTYGTMGAEMAAWGVFQFFIVRHAFANREKWAWLCLALMLGVWYVPDTGMSLYTGVIANAVGNTVVLALIGVPLLFTRPAFFASR